MIYRLSPLLTASLFSLAFFVTISPASAEESAAPEFTGNVSIVSDYVFRGISQSNEIPALQAGVDYIHNFDETTSIYAGLWGSNVNFNDGNEASLESDWYGGVRKTYGNWKLDGGFIYYLYPGAKSSLNYNFIEVQAKIGYDFGTAYIEASENYSPDYFGGSGSSYYSKLSATVPLPHDFAANAFVANQTIKKNAKFGVPDYNTWGIGATYTYHKDWAFSLNYLDTDLSKAECRDGCGGRVVFGITKTF